MRRSGERFERFVKRSIMIYTALKDLHYVEWFVLRWMVCSTLNDLNYVTWFVQLELFVLRWMSCITLNDLYNVEWFFTSEQNLCDLKRFVQHRQICTTLNDSAFDGWFIQRWVIWVTMNYWNRLYNECQVCLFEKIL